ncbi:MAG: BON domain-containing protein [Candidatus Nitricoxidivorans perseverans]|uniref:BON domain-containing protein n=1 Tax=Candidatus Nitricoxidivorans perseverans TaxID=2975601 RepID=A0AA49FJQ3_9PROT|nr:MAG: BON domain-containing protein [Candidatus Nitricoxidivorans perseverans]
MKNALSTATLTALLLAILAPGLTGCVPAAAVGAGAGALMITDRRHAETYLADEGIEIRAVNRVGEKFGDRVHVNVTSYNRMVLVTGEVPDAAARAEVEKIVGGVPNVKTITNELQVAGTSSFAARSNDAYLTSKVKARFLDHNKFPATKVKVVTEAGAVHLLGLVTQREADAAVDIARTTGGVLKVVRLFEIISEERARYLDSQPGGSASPPAEKK